MTARITLSFALVLFALSAAAEKKKDLSNVQIDVAGGAHVRLVHTVVGEPIIEPEQLEIMVTCPGGGPERRLRLLRTCLWTDYDYDENDKVLTLTLNPGRLDPRVGKVECDQLVFVKVPLAEACTPAKANKAGR